MALNISPVHRNLHTRVSFLYLEFEDWFVVMGLAALTNIFGRWIDRQMFGIPMNVFLQYIVPVLSIPYLMLFKYGNPGGYRNFAQILQTARGTNPTFLFSMQSLPQLLQVGKGFKDDVTSAPNTKIAMR